jgi:hypothetical protein
MFDDLLHDVASRLQIVRRYVESNIQDEARHTRSLANRSGRCPMPGSYQLIGCLYQAGQAVRPIRRFPAAAPAEL